MAKLDYWATPPLSRQQSVLFSPTLDENVSEDHPVRILDEVLSSLEWASWESHYPFRVGQPPIHPRRLAAAILYGWTVGIKSGRQLEYASNNNLDFIWLLEGLKPDHSTFCKFRAKFQQELKDLFKQVVRYAMTLGMVQLNQVAFDGTQVRANASRCRCWTTESIEKVLQSLDQRVEQMLQEAETADAQDRALLGDASTELPEELKSVQKRREKLRAVSETLQELDQAKRKEGRKAKSFVPKTDTDARILPNKTGGYAANFTPVNVVDSEYGIVVHTEVIRGNCEFVGTLDAIDWIEEMYGKYPEEALADTAFATGPNLKGMEQRDVEFYSPVKSKIPQDGNPARREDPTTPVPQHEWDALPYRGRKNKLLDKTAFVYVESEDTYYCPMGRPLTREKSQANQRYGQTVQAWLYRCHDCQDCPLRSHCVQPNSKSRTISRDEYEPYRERVAAKMTAEANRKKYNKRSWIAETPFAHLKASLGLRQFLTRGIANVDSEWRWACTAFNLKKIIHQILYLRALATQMN